MSCDLPAGPPEPAWEQAKRWIERPIEFWSECHATYGDTFTVQLGSQGPTVLFCDPLAVKDVFALRREQYACGKYNEHYRLIMGDLSLLVQDGEPHTEQRRFLTPSFAADAHQEWLENLVRLANQSILAWQPGEIIPVRPFVHRIVFENILWFLFRDRQSEICQLLRNVFLKDLTKDYGTWSPWARFAKWHPLLRNRLGREIQLLREHELPEDDGGLFQRMACHMDAEGRRLTEEQIEDHVFTMLIAGVDPTMLSTSWALYWVHATPDVGQELRSEIASRGNDLSDMHESPWLDATVKETLRMIPIVTTPSGRRLTQATTIQGQVYPAETTLLPCTYLVHRRPSLYELPDQFRPERFLERTYRGYEYFPFGGGLRTCIGAKLAELTMKVLLVEVLRHARLEPAWVDEVVPIRHGTLLAPSENLRLRVVRVD